VTLAGIKVNQTVALVNYAAWNGDGTTSGLVGLAYPNMYVLSRPRFSFLPDKESIYSGVPGYIDTNDGEQQYLCLRW
jgi:hypothetical protein